MLYAFTDCDAFPAPFKKIFHIHITINALLSLKTSCTMGYNNYSYDQPPPLSLRHY